MINLLLNNTFCLHRYENGKPVGEPPPPNTAETLFKGERESDEDYDSWAASVKESEKLSRYEVKQLDGKFIDGRKIKLTQEESAGIKAIADITGFSRQTAQQFYALALSGGYADNIYDFINGMVGEPDFKHGQYKNRISAKEADNIISSLSEGKRALVRTSESHLPKNEDTAKSSVKVQNKEAQAPALSQDDIAEIEKASEETGIHIKELRTLYELSISSGFSFSMKDFISHLLNKSESSYLEEKNKENQNRDSTILSIKA